MYYGLQPILVPRTEPATSPYGGNRGTTVEVHILVLNHERHLTSLCGTAFRHVKHCFLMRHILPHLFRHERQKVVGITLTVFEYIGTVMLHGQTISEDNGWHQTGHGLQNFRNFPSKCYPYNASARSFVYRRTSNY